MVTPTGYTALDLVGFTDKGAFDGNVAYVKNDLVHHGGNIWRVLADDVTGIIPSEGINYTLFIGEPTNLVERIIAPLEINPSEHAWTVGRQFIYNDLLYEVIDTIAIGDSLVAYESDPTNANIKLALPVETQLLALKALDEAIVDVIAPTETSPATAAHAVGEQFFYNGKIYTVTTAIEIGHTLTVGTNITESDTLTEQIDSKQDELTFDSTPTANSTNPVTSGGVKSALDSKDIAIAKLECLVLSASSVSALPYDFSNANIETDMVCINSVLSNPSAQLSDWEVDTDTAGRARITGAISGTTDIKLYLMKSR